MGGDGPKGPPLQISNISNFGEIWTIYVNLHEKNKETGKNFLGDPIRGVRGAVAPIKNSVISDFGDI